ncbi:hypothetical protein BDZ91DRAFT_763151 [Kalaharituber pfeilii]|nr:hypothetical protein BDZ91DRAFT_763151 [Kalaharituber pfeilii]
METVQENIERHQFSHSTQDASLDKLLLHLLVAKRKNPTEKAESPECRWCGEEEESTTHVLTRCKTWKKKLPGGRTELIDPPKSKDKDFLVGDEKETGISDLFFP